MYCLILPLILNMDAKSGIELAQKVGVTIIFLGLICAALFYILYKPAEELIQGINAGVAPSPEKIMRARKSLSKMDFYYMLIGIIFYPLGTIVNLLSDYLHQAPIVMDLVVSRLIAALIWGFVVGIFTVRINNISLIKTKIMLNIYDLDNTKKSGLKYESIFHKFFIPFFILLLLSLSFSAIFYYHLSKEIINDKNAEAGRLLVEAAQGELSEKELQSALSSFTETGNFRQDIRLDHYLKVILVLFAMLIVIFITIIYEYQTHLKSLMRQIDKLGSDTMDLSQRINVISFDDIGIMTAGINRIISNLLKTFTTIRLSSKEVNGQGQEAERKILESKKATSELKPIIESFESNTDSQIKFISSTVVQFNEMLKVIENSVQMIKTQIEKVINTSEYVRDMGKAFNEINDSSEKNIQIFNSLIASIEEGNGNIANSIKSIQAIDEAGKKINEIAAIITDIASQTSLLAMNAAIEASHAGQYGKGFAVVSDEIKKLSESSSESAHGISSIIKEMNDKISKGSAIFMNLKGTFEHMNLNMNKTKLSLNGILESTQAHSRKAIRNINEIDELLELTNQLKTETENLGRDSKNIETSISLLSSSSGTIKADNEKLALEIKNLVKISDEVSGNFKAIFIGIHELDSMISQYKMT